MRFFVLPLINRQGFQPSRWALPVSLMALNVTLLLVLLLAGYEGDAVQSMVLEPPGGVLWLLAIATIGFFVLPRVHARWRASPTYLVPAALLAFSVISGSALPATAA